MKKFVGILMTLFIIIAFSGHTQQVPNNKQFNVLVSVACNNEHTKTMIESYINRELRKLGDVLIDSNNLQPTHAILLIAIEHEKIGVGKTGGMSIAATYAESLYMPPEYGPTWGTLFNPLSSQKIANDFANKKRLVPVLIYRDSFLTIANRSGNTNNLSDNCKSIVARFDVKTLQLARKRR